MNAADQIVKDHVIPMLTMPSLPGNTIIGFTVDAELITASIIMADGSGSDIPWTELCRHLCDCAVLHPPVKPQCLYVLAALQDIQDEPQLFVQVIRT